MTSFLARGRVCPDDAQVGALSEQGVSSRPTPPSKQGAGADIGRGRLRVDAPIPEETLQKVGMSIFGQAKFVQIMIVGVSWSTHDLDEALGRWGMCGYTVYSHQVEKQEHISELKQHSQKYIFSYGH